MGLLAKRRRQGGASRLAARHTILTGLLGALLLMWAGLIPPAARAQETSGAPQGEEIVANLATGRVVVAVVKDAILVATVERPIEAETRVPAPVALGSERLGVILGAVDWSSPSAHQELARLDKELPHLRGKLIVTTGTPSLQHAGITGEAADIEDIGQGLLERLDQLAQGLHGGLDWPSNEPVAELIIADYLGGYGPEVWQLTYGLKQDEQSHDYWITRVERPVYLQFWPPEKGEPRTLLEFDYPSEGAPPSLLELLRRKDPALEGVMESDHKMAEVAEHFLRSESSKVSAADATEFLRAALDAISPHGARESVAIIGEESGFAWILAPPSEPSTPGEKPVRLPGAPSLMGPPSK